MTEICGYGYFVFHLGPMYVSNWCIRCPTKKHLNLWGHSYLEAYDNTHYFFASYINQNKSMLSWPLPNVWSPINLTTLTFCWWLNSFSYTTMVNHWLVSNRIKALTSYLYIFLPQLWNFLDSVYVLNIIYNYAFIQSWCYGKRKTVLFLITYIFYVLLMMQNQMA